MFGPNVKDGWKAILVAICASIMQAVVLGVNNSFPNFVALMKADEDLGYPTDSMLSLVQALSLGFAGCMAIPAGFIVQKFGSRLSSLISAIALILCMILTAVAANSGGSMIGLYSIFMAVAVAFMMSPGATATSSWFDKRAALGMGICFSGGGTGSLSIPRIAGALAANFSWRTSFLILAAISSLAVVASFFVCLRPTDGDEETDDKVIEVRPAEADAANNSQQQELAVVPADGFPITVVTAATSGTVTPSDKSQKAAKFNYHTDKATWKQLIFECLLTRNFLGLFFAYATFATGFYAMLYIAVPYPLSMGTPGGPYADAAPISVDSASNVFVPFGILETVGGPFLGWVATRSDERLVFIGSMGMLTVASAYYAICRTLWDHLVIFIFFGAGCAAFFATFGTMIAQRFWGPNLSVIMSAGFTGSGIGGFLGSPVSTEIVKAQGGDYTYVTVMMAFAFFASGLCIMFVVQDVEDADAHLKATGKSVEEKKPLLSPRSPDNQEEAHIVVAVDAGADVNDRHAAASPTSAVLASRPNHPTDDDAHNIFSLRSEPALTGEGEGR